jgi:transcription initiation factor TFIIB
MIEASEYKCPDCGVRNPFWNKAKGELICRSCGMIIEDRLIDFDKEWRDFEDDKEKKSRVGTPVTYLEPKIGSDIRKQDIYGLDWNDKKKFMRLRTWQRRTSSSIERNLDLALSELKRVSSVLELPSSVEEESARIYTNALHKGLIRGRGIEKIVLGAVHAACRLFEIPKTLKEISNVSGMEKKEIAKSYRFLVKNLNLKIIPQDPNNFVTKFCNELGLSTKTQMKAVELIEKAKKNKIVSGKNPQAIAIAAIYAASKIAREKKMQYEMAKVANITEVTLRNRFSEIVDGLKIKRLVK